MKVLVVDTDLHSLHAVSGLLRRHGHEPLLASSYEEGKRLWISDHPPMLIADIRLGQFNGLQLLLRARADRQDVTAVITCPFPDKSLEDETRRFGGTFLVKPVKPEELIAAVPHPSVSATVSPSAGLVERRTEDRRRTTIPDFEADRRVFDRRLGRPTNAPGAAAFGNRSR